jgi:hypothetical protein
MMARTAHVESVRGALAVTYFRRGSGIREHDFHEIGIIIINSNNSVEGVVLVLFRRATAVPWTTAGCVYPTNLGQST